MSLDSVNHELRLYVLSYATGYSCIGFEVARRRHNEVAKWLGSPDRLDPATDGAPEAFTKYEDMMDAGRAHHTRTGQRCDADLAPQLVGLEGRRVAVVDAYDDARRFWVGKSTGWFPVHLELRTRSASGGPAVTGAPFKSLKTIK